jgi:hypothetical protein
MDGEVRPALERRQNRSGDMKAARHDLLVERAGRDIGDLRPGLQRLVHHALGDRVAEPNGRTTPARARYPRIPRDWDLRFARNRRPISRACGAPVNISDQIINLQLICRVIQAWPS